jgi:hypothetical protein
MLAVEETRSLMKVIADGSLVTDDNLVAQLFVQGLVLGDCPRVIPHCASLLPKRLYPELRKYLQELREKEYRGEIVAMAPGPTAEAQAEMQPTFRSVAIALESYLDSPFAPEDVPEAEVDQFWVMLHEQPLRQGIQCKREGCLNEAMALSVMCPRHHYQMMIGHLPRGLE